MSALFRMLFRAIAPGGANARLTVLIFHRVLTAPDPLRPGEPTATAFEAKLRWIASHFHVMPLGEAVRGLKAGSLPERPLSITFDDGYADNHDIAMPILRKLGLPATFFIATGYLDGGRMFNDTVIEAVRHAKGDELDLTDMQLGCHSIRTDEDRCHAVDAILTKLKYMVPQKREVLAEAIGERTSARLPADLMMTSEKVAAMHEDGMEIGGHTVSHPILREVDLETARREIGESRKRLESIISERVRLFAYPNGRPGRDYTAEHVTMVRDLGFDAAASTAWGTARTGADVFQIPRFTPWDSDIPSFALRMVRNLIRNPSLVRASELVSTRP